MKENFYEIILESEISKEYIKYSNMAKEFFKKKEKLPTDLKKMYKKSIENYRNFLLINKLLMPSPKINFNKNDKKTWKYLDSIIVQEENGKWAFLGMKVNKEWNKK